MKLAKELHYKSVEEYEQAENERLSYEVDGDLIHIKLTLEKGSEHLNSIEQFNGQIVRNLGVVLLHHGFKQALYTLGLKSLMIHHSSDSRLYTIGE